MGLLNDISGLRGENLASGMLAHLLLRSEPLRSAFVEMLSPLSPIGPIISQRHFAVFTEIATEDRKRVDLLVQTDNAILGIENKFLAKFQSGQPRVYLDLVKEKADLLEKAWGGEFQPMLIVLAPESRRREAEREISEQGIGSSCFYLPWQELLSTFRRPTDGLHGLGPVDRFLVDELSRYVNAHCGEVNLRQLMPHLTKPWQEWASPVVREVLNAVIWPLLREEIRDSYTFGGGRAYYGYYFLGNQDQGAPWLGFVDSQYFAPSTDPGSSLMAALRSEESASFLCRELGAQRVDAWKAQGFECVEIPFEEAWTSQSDWVPTVEAINEVLSS